MKEAIHVKKENGILNFEDFGGYESRNTSVIELIKLTDEKYNLPDFKTIFISTGDKYVKKNDMKALAFSNYNTTQNIIPDFVFFHWNEAKIYDYEKYVIDIFNIGFEQPQTNKIGWVGCVDMSPKRKTLINLSRQYANKIEAISMNWRTLTNYTSLFDQIKKWKYLVDIEGIGYSGRLKILLFSQRCIFVVDRVWKDITFKYIKPWEHYVPVNSDLSNLIEMYDYIQKNPEIEQKIIKNASEMAKKYLTRENALAVMREALLNNL